MQENINFTISREGIKVRFHRDYFNGDLQPSDLSNSTFQSLAFHNNEEHKEPNFTPNSSPQAPNQELFPYHVATIVPGDTDKQTTLKIKAIKYESNQFSTNNKTNQRHCCETNSEYFGDTEQNRTSESVVSENKNHEISSEYEADDEDIDSEISKVSSIWEKRCFALLHLLLESAATTNKKDFIHENIEPTNDFHNKNLNRKITNTKPHSNPSNIFDSTPKQKIASNMDMNGSHLDYETINEHESKPRKTRQSDRSPQLSMLMAMIGQSEEDNEATKKFKRCWNAKKFQKSPRHHTHSARNMHNYDNVDDKIVPNQISHPSRRPLLNYNKPIIKPAPRRLNIQNPSKYIYNQNNLKGHNRKHNIFSHHPLHSISRHKNLFSHRPLKKNIYEDRNYYDSLPYSSKEIHSLECLEKVKQSLMNRKQSPYGHLLVHKPDHYFLPLSNENLNNLPISENTYSYDQYSSNYEDMDYSSSHSDSYDRSEENYQKEDGIFFRENSDKEDLYSDIHHKEKLYPNEVNKHKQNIFEFSERNSSSHIPTRSTNVSSEWDYNPLIFNTMVMTPEVIQDNISYSDNGWNATIQLTQGENHNNMIMNDENADYNFQQGRNALELPANNRLSDQYYASDKINHLNPQPQTSGVNNTWIQQSSNILNPENLQDIYKNLPKDYEFSAGQWIHIQPSPRKENVQRSIYPAQINNEEPRQLYDENDVELRNNNGPNFNGSGSMNNVKNEFQYPFHEFHTNSKFNPEHLDNIAPRARNNILEGTEQDHPYKTFNGNNKLTQVLKNEGQSVSEDPQYNPYVSLNGKTIKSTPQQIHQEVYSEPSGHIIENNNLPLNFNPENKIEALKNLLPPLPAFTTSIPTRQFPSYEINPNITPENEYLTTENITISDNLNQKVLSNINLTVATPHLSQIYNYPDTEVMFANLHNSTSLKNNKESNHGADFQGQVSFKPFFIPQLHNVPPDIQNNTSEHFLNNKHQPTELHNTTVNGSTITYSKPREYVLANETKYTSPYKEKEVFTENEKKIQYSNFSESSTEFTGTNTNKSTFDNLHKIDTHTLEKNIKIPITGLEKSQKIKPYDKQLKSNYISSKESTTENNNLMEDYNSYWDQSKIDEYNSGENYLTNTETPLTSFSPKHSDNFRGKNFKTYQYVDLLENKFIADPEAINTETPTRGKQLPSMQTLHHNFQTPKPQSIHTEELNSGEQVLSLSPKSGIFHSTHNHNDFPVIDSLIPTKTDEPTPNHFPYSKNTRIVEAKNENLFKQKETTSGLLEAHGMKIIQQKQNSSYTPEKEEKIKPKNDKYFTTIGPEPANTDFTKPHSSWLDKNSIPLHRSLQIETKNTNELDAERGLSEYELSFNTVNYSELTEIKENALGNTQGKRYELYPQHTQEPNLNSSKKAGEKGSNKFQNGEEDLTDSHTHDSAGISPNVHSEEFLLFPTTLKSESETMTMENNSKDTMSSTTVKIVKSPLTLFSSTSSPNEELIKEKSSLPYSKQTKVAFEVKSNRQRNSVGMLELKSPTFDNQFHQNNEKYNSHNKNDSSELYDNLENTDTQSFDYNYSFSSKEEQYLQENTSKTSSYNHYTQEINKATTAEPSVTSPHNEDLSKRTYSIHARNDNPEYAGSLFLLNPRNGEVTRSIPVTGKVISLGSEFMTNLPRFSMSYSQFPTDTTLMTAHQDTTHSLQNAKMLHDKFASTIKPTELQNFGYRDTLKMYTTTSHTENKSSRNANFVRKETTDQSNAITDINSNLISNYIPLQHNYNSLPIGQNLLPNYPMTQSDQSILSSSAVLTSIYKPRELLKKISVSTSTPSLVTAIQQQNYTCESAYKQYIYKYFIRVLLKEYLEELSKNNEHHCSHNCTIGKPHVCDECIKALIKEQREDEGSLVQKIKSYNSQHCQDQLTEKADNILTETHPCTIYSRCKFDVLSNILEKIGKWLKII